MITTTQKPPVVLYSQNLVLAFIISPRFSEHLKFYSSFKGLWIRPPTVTNRQNKKAVKKMSLLCMLKHQGKGRPVDNWSGPLTQVSQMYLTCYPEDYRAISTTTIIKGTQQQSDHLATEHSFSYSPKAWQKRSRSSSCPPLVQQMITHWTTGSSFCPVRT